jgi:hypothetical protein
MILNIQIQQSEAYCADQPTEGKIRENHYPDIGVRTDRQMPRMYRKEND